MANGAERKLVIRDIEEAMKLFGKYDANTKLIQAAFPVDIITRGNEVIIRGPETAVDETEAILRDILAMIRAGVNVGQREITYAVRMAKEGDRVSLSEVSQGVIITNARGKEVRPKTVGQKLYVKSMQESTVVFAIGPAGTGKTYLAIAMAVAALRNREVSRIVLTRPAVEAGEKLGFLPGDLQDKVDPYLRPLYDALYDILGVDVFSKYMEKGTIEVAPLAYMRGRTLDDSFVILDEAQNTTREQMKMFLTRLGFGSKAVVTGDLTQTDLPKGKESGLKQASRILNGINGIAVVYLTDKDVVRHTLVQKIIKAYERNEHRD